jgi:hypothetical protein
MSSSSSQKRKIQKKEDEEEENQKRLKEEEETEKLKQILHERFKFTNSSCVDRNQCALLLFASYADIILKAIQNEQQHLSSQKTQ